MYINEVESQIKFIYEVVNKSALKYSVFESGYGTMENKLS